MKVYVDELPKSCNECQFCDKDNGVCEMLGQYFRDGYDYTDCPLQSLTDYIKQVRKEVCEEFREKLKNNIYLSRNREYWFAYQDDLLEILDQIQGETK